MAQVSFIPLDMALMQITPQTANGSPLLVSFRSFIPHLPASLTKFSKITRQEYSLLNLSRAWMFSILTLMTVSMALVTSAPRASCWIYYPMQLLQRIGSEKWNAKWHLIFWNNLIHYWSSLKVLDPFHKGQMPTRLAHCPPGRNNLHERAEKLRPRHPYNTHVVEWEPSDMSGLTCAAVSGGVRWAPGPKQTLQAPCSPWGNSSLESRWSVDIGMIARVIFKELLTSRLSCFYAGICLLNHWRLKV